jgi:hypothetical protein
VPRVVRGRSVGPNPEISRNYWGQSTRARGLLLRRSSRREDTRNDTADKHAAKQLDLFWNDVDEAVEGAAKTSADYVTALTCLGGSHDC